MIQIYVLETDVLLDFSQIKNSVVAVVIISLTNEGTFLSF